MILFLKYNFSEMAKKILQNAEKVVMERVLRKLKKMTTFYKS